MDKHYTLTARRLIFTANSSGATYIGQMEGCDLRLPNPTPYEDTLWAKIEPNTGSEGWHIVRLYPSASITVNGTKLGRIHYLENQDTIHFGDERFRYRVVPGSERQTLVIYKTSRYPVLLGLVLLGVILLAVLFLRPSRSNQLTQEMIEEAQTSVFQLRVDSIYRMHGDSILDRYFYLSAPVGTAFLTSDSLLVTARHCVEPWLNLENPTEIANLYQSNDPVIRMALLAETERQIEDDSSYYLRSYITLIADGNTHVLTSDDFHIRSDRDEIVELGDYSHTYYWRSIARRYNLEEMTLDDVATMKFTRNGSIQLADKYWIEQHLSQDYPLTFIGFPNTQDQNETVNVESGALKQRLRHLQNEEASLYLLAHDGNLSHGFSGGPVLISDGHEFRAVGIISVLDTKNQYRSYSVPTSEIKH